MSGVKSVERAFAVLQFLAVGAAGVSEIAERLDLPKSTVSRLLSTLEQLGAVEQVAVGGPYGIGPLIVELGGGRMPTPTLTGLARPQLQELVDSVGEVAGLAMLDEAGMVLYLDEVEADNAVQLSNWTGHRLPPHTVASGLVMLAGAPDPARQAALANPLEQLTTNTMTEPAALLARLAEIRERGVAWTMGEAVDEVASVAAPIFDNDGAVIGAIHLHGPMYRFPGTRRPDELEALVVAASTRITKGLYQ